MPTNTPCASPMMRTSLQTLSPESPTDVLSPFDYEQMCLALALIAERIHELKQKQTTQVYAQGEAQHEKF